MTNEVRFEFPGLFWREKHSVLRRPMVIYKTTIVTIVVCGRSEEVFKDCRGSFLMIKGIKLGGK